MQHDPDLIQDIFDQAAELPMSEREAYLDEKCHGDAVLKAKIQSWLAQLKKIPTVEGVAPSQQPGPYAPGDRLGQYTITRELGVGGFGVVYLARQDNPSRDVAIKVILPEYSGRDSKFLERFKAEQEALARLEHPYIATLYTCGQDDQARPYIVMQYIDGEHLDTACDSHQLDIGERLRIAAELCDAVSHAHSKGLIHRDLKPGNILLSLNSDDRKWHPTVIDFGIAKAIEMPLSAQELTQGGRPMGTYGYMSPEQADGDLKRIGTRTDVYALGVILYQLLAGRLPLEQAELDEYGDQAKKKMIREVDPPRPGSWLKTSSGQRGQQIARDRSTEIGDLSRELSRELEHIPMRALRKEPEERYDSAKTMGDDIRRYLKGDRLVAGPDSAAYRLRKSIRRNKGAYSAVAAIIMVLIAGVVVSLMFAFEAQFQEAAVRKQGYFHNIMQAGLLLKESDPKTAEKHLAKAKSLRDATSGQMPIEWNYLTSQIGHGLEYQKKLSTKGNCRAVACSQDGRVLATQAGGEIKCWDSNSGDLLHSWDSGRSANLLAMSSDGALLASAVHWPRGPNRNPDLVIKIWDVSKGELLTEVTDRDAESCALVFLPMSHMLQAVDQNGHVLKWDADTGKLVSDTVLQSKDGESYFGEPPEPQRVGPSYGGHGLFSPRGVQAAKAPKYVGDYVAFSQDGTRLVTMVAIWDTRTGRFLQDVASLVTPERSSVGIPNTRIPTAIAVNGNGTRVAMTGNFTGKRVIKIIDLESGRVTEQDHWIGEIKGLDFTGDGAVVVAGSVLGKTLYLDVETGKVLAEDSTGELVNVLAAAPAGPLVFMGMHGGHCRVVDSEIFTDIVTDPGLVTGDAVRFTGGQLTLSNDGMLVAIPLRGPTAFGEIEIWNTFTQELVAILHQPGLGSSVMVFSPDGTKLAVGSSDKQVFVWSMVTGKHITTLNGHEDRLLGIDFDQESQRVVTACADQHVRIFDLDEPDRPLVIRTADKVAGWRDGVGASQRELGRGYSGKSAVRAVAFGSDGKQVASLGDDQRVSIWDSRSGEVIGSFPAFDEIPCFDEMPWTYLDSQSLSFVDHEQGRMLACVTANRTSLLDIESGKVHFTMQREWDSLRHGRSKYGGSPHSSTFTSDGSRFVSATGRDDGPHEIVIFSTDDDGSELCRIPTPDAVGRIVMTPNHAFIAYGTYVRCLDKQTSRLIGKRSYKELNEELRPLVLEIIEECDGNESELLNRIDEEVAAAGSIRNSIARLLLLEIQAAETNSGNGVYARPPFTLEMAKRMDNVEEIDDAKSQILQARLLTGDIDEIKYLRAVYSQLLSTRQMLAIRSIYRSYEPPANRPGGGGDPTSNRD